MVTTTFSYNSGNFPGSGGRSSAEKPPQVVPAPPPVLGCPASAASALQAWRRRLLVRSTAIIYTKKPPRADWRRRRRFMADTSGSGTGSGTLIGSGCGGAGPAPAWGASGIGAPGRGYPSQHPKGQKGASQKKTKPLCRRGAKQSWISRTGLGCNGWKRGKSGTQCSGKGGKILEVRERVRGLEQAKIGKKRPKTGTERSTVPELFRNRSTPRSPYLSTFLPFWNSWNSIYIKRIKIYKNG